jgi:hypothetical protein
LILAVAGTRLADLVATIRRVWAIGPVGSEIPVTIACDGGMHRSNPPTATTF